MSNGEASLWPVEGNTSPEPWPGGNRHKGRSKMGILGMKGRRPMRRVWRGMAAMGGSLLLASGTMAAPPANNGASSEAMTEAVVQQEDKETQQLLQRLTELSQQIQQHGETAQGYRYQIAQADVMFQLAARSKGKEREEWLKMAVDCQYSAAVGAPENDPAPYQRLAQLPAALAQSFPGTQVSSYAALQEIQADYLRVLNKNSEDPGKAQLHLRDRLLRFAQDYPQVAEAPRAVMEGARISEELNRIDDARRCYQYLRERYPGTAIATKASGSLWRLGQGKEVLQLQLPLLYATPERAGQPFDLKEVRGKLVVVYFWTSTTAQAGADFDALKQLTDRYQFNGLEVVYVNLDEDLLKAHGFLSGRLTAGTHVYQKGGLESVTAQSFGIKSLPEVFLVSPEGVLLKHSLKVSQLEKEIATLIQSKK